jgi:hypothetical protein
MTDIQKKLIQLNNTQEQEYEDLVNSLIRKKYSLSQELSILRRRNETPEKFAEYYAYAEECKLTAKEMLGIN